MVTAWLRSVYVVGVVAMFGKVGRGSDVVETWWNNVAPIASSAHQPPRSAVSNGSSSYLPPSCVHVFPRRGGYIGAQTEYGAGRVRTTMQQSQGTAISCTFLPGAGRVLHSVQLSRCNRSSPTQGTAMPRTFLPGRTSLRNRPPVPLSRRIKSARLC